MPTATEETEEEEEEEEEEREKEQGRGGRREEEVCKWVGVSGRFMGGWEDKIGS